MSRMVIFSGIFFVTGYLVRTFFALHFPGEG